MVKIRLRRTGAKKRPHYRVIAADARAPRDGRFIEILGHYIPLTEPATFKVHEDRVLYWLSVGAQPTDTVKRYLEREGVMKRLSRVKAGESIEDVLGIAQVSEPELEPAPADLDDDGEDEVVAAETA